jgi:hypothetical protein
MEPRAAGPSDLIISAQFISIKNSVEEVTLQ